MRAGTEGAEEEDKGLFLGEGAEPVIMERQKDEEERKQERERDRGTG